MKRRASITKNTALVLLLTLVFGSVYGLFLADKLSLAVNGIPELIVNVLGGAALVALLIVSWTELRVDVWLGPSERQRE